MSTQTKNQSDFIETTQEAMQPAESPAEPSKTPSVCLILTVLLMGVLGGVEVDIFVPSFPDLQRTFGLTPFMVELTLGLNLAAHCFTSLIVGNLGDRYGRRPVILLGLLIFLVGSLFCVYADAYWHMLLGRILQGIGVSGPVVLSYIVVADHYSTEMQQKIMGGLNGIIAMAMAFAPTVGSYVNYYYSWQGNFAILLILAILCFIAGLIFLPKSQKNPSVSLSLKEYGPVFRTRSTFYYILTLVLVLQGFWIFVGMSPIFYMEDLGVDLKDFGYYQGALACSFSVVSLNARFLLNRFGQKKCLGFCVGLLAIFMAILPVMMVLNVRDPMLITGVMLLNSVGLIFPITILWPLMLRTIPGALSRISAVAIGARLLVTAFSIQLASYFYDGTIRSLGAVMWVFTALAFLAGYRLFQVEDVFGENE